MASKEKMDKTICSKTVLRDQYSLCLEDSCVREGKGIYGSILGSSLMMRRIFEAMKMLSKTSVTVLITGESGTGKELIARAVHDMGPGNNRPFVAINCGALPSGLIESELFGHEKGAFTGALAKKTGKIELASGGTLFLDEIATMPLNLQVKLLRFLEERTITRVGGNDKVKLNIRVLAATNVDLKMAIKRGDFREDLYYRLNVVPIEVPPLRDRGEDILVLTDYFMKKYSSIYSRKIREFSPAALLAIRDYSWPGNVRELKNIIERIVVFSTDNSPIKKRDLPVEILSNEPTRIEANDLHKAMRSFERRLITSVLEKTGWNRLEAAQLMKVHRNTLLKKMKDLEIKKT